VAMRNDAHDAVHFHVEILQHLRNLHPLFRLPSALL
jgi:hypothetical protein